MKKYISPNSKPRNEDGLNCKTRRKNKQRVLGKIYGHEWYIEYLKNKK